MIEEVPLWARAKRLAELRDADGYSVDPEAGYSPDPEPATAVLHYVGDDVDDLEVGMESLVGHTQAHFDALREDGIDLADLV